MPHIRGTESPVQLQFIKKSNSTPNKHMRLTARENFKPPISVETRFSSSWLPTFISARASGATARLNFSQRHARQQPMSIICGITHVVHTCHSRHNSSLFFAYLCIQKYHTHAYLSYISRQKTKTTKITSVKNGEIQPKTRPAAAKKTTKG